MAGILNNKTSKLNSSELNFHKHNFIVQYKDNPSRGLILYMYVLTNITPNNVKDWHTLQLQHASLIAMTSSTYKCTAAEYAALNNALAL